MGFRVDVLHIHEQEVRHLHECLELAEKRLLPRERLSRRVDAGVDAPELGLLEQVEQEIQLEQGLPAADRDAALRPPVRPVALRLVQQIIRRPQLATLQAIPGIHIVAVEAAHRTTLQKDDEARARPINRAERLDRVDATFYHHASSSGRTHANRL